MKNKLILLFIFVLLFSNNVVYAQNFVSYPEKIVIDTSDKPSFTGIEPVFNFNGYYHTVSPIYEFFDESGIYNIVYVSGIKSFIMPNEDSMIVHWLKIKNDEIISDIVLEHDAELFGNAIYKNGYLYVVYGRSALYKENGLDINTVEFTKYDINGKIIGNLKIKGKDAINSFTYDSEAGTRVPFSYGNPSNCDVAISGNILVTFFGRLSYGIHQASLFLAVDTDTMTLKNDNAWNFYQDIIYASHSMDQRVLADRDGNIITIDMADSGQRGYNIFKIVSTDNLNNGIYKFNPFHFREASKSGFGYNNTYSSMGNLIEVSDGYIFISASDKELSKEYLNDNYENPWNIFVQKYKHDFENVKTDDTYYPYTGSTEEEIKNMQMLNEDIRYITGERTGSIANYHLRANQNNYGVKWLTDFDMDSTVDIIRAIKVDNERVLIIYEKTPVKNEPGIYAKGLYDKREIYYMVIDKDANLIVEPVKLYGVEMSTNIHYQYKDGYVLWTTTDGKSKNLTINKLKVYDKRDIGDIPINEIKINGNSRITSSGSTSLDVSYYPIESNERKMVTWTSSNDKVATVNEYGTVKGISGGTVIITATTANGVSDSYKITVNSFKVNKNDISLFPGEEFKIEYLEKIYDGEEVTDDKITFESKNTDIATVDNNGLVKAISEGETVIYGKYYNQTKNTIKVKVINYLKGDMNRNGKIDLQDIIILLKKYLKTLETTTEDLKIGDMNEDGSIGIKDIILLLRTYLNTN